eukprot:796-Eustigmatos_ZCMA.PRE.1
MDALHNKPEHKARELYFRITLEAYAESDPNVKRRKAQVVDWHGEQWVNFHADEELVAPMSSLNRLGLMCEET